MVGALPADATIRVGTMIDVVIYGYDRLGRLRLRERAFFSLRGLAHFFASQQSKPWDWAEVTTIGPDDVRRVVRYSRDELIALIQRSGSGPTPN